MDAPLDHALRALARLLARQAARDIFAHSDSERCDGQATALDKGSQ
jgi:hypothetical protein